MIALAAAVGSAAVLLVGLARLFMGPTLSDRALAANGVLLKCALVCAAAATASDRPDWIDAAFALVIGAVVLNVAMLKVFRLRSFQAPLSREDG
jgi:multicomponent Na+:H+ antiporter subunit F